MKYRVRPLAPFHSIVLSGPGSLRVTQAPRRSLAIKTSSALAAGVSASVVGRVLTISFAAPVVIPMRRWSELLHYDIAVRELRALTIRGAAIAEIPDLDVDELELSVAGSATLHVAKLTADVLRCNLRDSATVKIAGDVETQEVELTDKSLYEAGKLVSDFACLEVRGPGQAAVAVHHELSATVLGSGQVKYRGLPELSPHVFGPGTIQRERGRGRSDQTREVPQR